MIIAIFVLSIILLLLSAYNMVSTGNGESLLFFALAYAINVLAAWALSATAGVWFIILGFIVLVIAILIIAISK